MTTPAALQPAKRVVPAGVAAMDADVWSERQVRVLRTTIAKDLNRDEMMLLGYVSRAAGADPFQGEVVPTVYNKNDPEKRSVSFIFSLGWARKKANAGGLVASLGEPEFMDASGKWWPVWPYDGPPYKEDELPVAARIVTKRIVRNTDGTVAQIIDEETRLKMASARRWAVRGSPHWKDDPVYMLGVAVTRAATRKLQIAPEIEGVETAIGAAGIDYEARDGQAYGLLPEGAADEPQWTKAAMSEALKNAGLKVVDLAPIVGGALSRDTWGETVGAWFDAHPDAGVLDLVALALERKQAAEPDSTGATSEAASGPAHAAGEAESDELDPPGDGEDAGFDLEAWNDELIQAMNAAAIRPFDVAGFLGVKFEPAPVHAAMKQRGLDIAGLVKAVPEALSKST